MIFITHLVFGFLFFLIATKLGILPFTFLIGLITVLSSLLIDIDHPNSYISNRIPILPKILSFFVEHRGIFHSLFGVVLIFSLFYLLLVVLLKLSIIYPIAILVGMLSHLFADALTIQGVMPFYPLSDFIIRGFIYTNSFSEILILILLIIIILLLLV